MLVPFIYFNVAAFVDASKSEPAWIAVFSELTFAVWATNIINNDKNKKVRERTVDAEKIQTDNKGTTDEL